MRQRDEHDVRWDDRPLGTPEQAQGDPERGTRHDVGDVHEGVEELPETPELAPGDQDRERDARREVDRGRHAADEEGDADRVPETAPVQGRRRGRDGEEGQEEEGGDQDEEDEE